MEQQMPIMSGSFNLGALPVLLGKDDPVILDIGCNDGSQTAVFLNLFTNSRVYAFEPDLRAQASFRKKINNERAELFDFAISDVDGTTVFHLSDGFSSAPAWKDARPGGWDLSGSIRKPKEHLAEFPWCKFDRTRIVETKKLDTWCSENGVGPIDFIWADVQGAEENLIKGGEEALRRTRYFYTEYSDQELYEGQIDLKSILDLLPNFQVVCRFSDDVLLRNTDWSSDART